MTTLSGAVVHALYAVGCSVNYCTHADVGTLALAVVAYAALTSSGAAVVAAAVDSNTPPTLVDSAVENAAVLGPEARVDSAGDTSSPVLATRACLVVGRHFLVLVTQVCSAVDRRFLAHTTRHCLVSGENKETSGLGVRRCWAWEDKATAAHAALPCSGVV